MTMGSSGKAAPMGPNFPHASLYVGDLAQNVVESQLFERFSRMGSVLSVRVCRDAVTKGSLGYGYVNFHKPQEAARALEELNFEVLEGRPLRLMWSHRDPAIRRSGEANVFIKNLDKSIDNKALFDTFSSFGKILSAKVAGLEDGMSKGYAFVHFETSEAAKEAINQVNGKLIKGKAVYVGLFKPRATRAAEMGEDYPKFTNVFVKNLGTEVKEAWLRQQVKECGAVTSVYIPTTGEGAEKKARGFAFIAFATSDAAHKAVTLLNGKVMEDGKTLFAGRAMKQEERAAELRHQQDARKRAVLQKRARLNLYIKNLEDTIGEERLREEFAKYGSVTSVKIMSDANGCHRGFGFVCFSRPDEAAKALAEMNGKIIETKPLYVALHQRKDERQAQLASQFAKSAYAARQDSIPPPIHKVNQRPSSLFTAPNYNAGGVPFTQTTANQHVNPPMPNYYMTSNTGYSNNLPSFVPNARGNGGGGRYGPSAPGHYMPPARGHYPAYGPPSGNFRTSGGGRSYNQGQVPGLRQPYEFSDARYSAAAGLMPPNAPAANFPVQYHQTARNRPAEGPYGHSVQAVSPAAPRNQKMDYASAASPSPVVDEKQVLGEQLYPLVAEAVGGTEGSAGKVTGMLLEMPNDDIVKLLHQPAKLTHKIQEAMAVLQESGLKG